MMVVACLNISAVVKKETLQTDKEGESAFLLKRVGGGYPLFSYIICWSDFRCLITANQRQWLQAWLR